MFKLIRSFQATSLLGYLLFCILCCRWQTEAVALPPNQSFVSFTLKYSAPHGVVCLFIHPSTQSLPLCPQLINAPMVAEDCVDTAKWLSLLQSLPERSLGRTIPSMAVLLQPAWPAPSDAKDCSYQRQLSWSRGGSECFKRDMLANTVKHKMYGM